MSLTIDLPRELEQVARETLAIELYRQRKISVGQVAAVLNLGVIQTEAWLAARHVDIPITIEELEAELNVR